MEQRSYFNVSSSVKLHKTILRKRVQNNKTYLNTVHFKIKKVVDRSKNEGHKNKDAAPKLKDFRNIRYYGIMAKTSSIDQQFSHIYRPLMFSH